MILSSPSEFEIAMEKDGLDVVKIDSPTLAHAAATLEVSGLLLVGEIHGVSQTSGAVYALSSGLDSLAIGLEWSHEEMSDPMKNFMDQGSFDLDELWKFSVSSEFFCGDGRITSGHFALLKRLYEEDRLKQIILFDRLDANPPVESQIREGEMATRLLKVWNRNLPLIVLTGVFHVRMGATDFMTMADHLNSELGGVEPAILRYEHGYAWSRGQLHDVSMELPAAPIVINLREATPASVPGKPTANGVY